MTRNERKKAAKRRQANRFDRAASMASASRNRDVRAIVRSNLAKPMSDKDKLEAKAWKGISCPIFREISKDKPARPMSPNQVKAYQTKLLG